MLVYWYFENISPFSSSRLKEKDKIEVTFCYFIVFQKPRMCDNRAISHMREDVMIATVSTTLAQQIR